MRDAANIAAIAALQPDYMGFVFHETSPRYAGGLHPDALSVLSEHTRKVGVFVHASCAVIKETAQKYRLDLIQLHGNDPPDRCLAVREICPVIKAVGVRSAEEVATATALYDGKVDFLLFDTKTPLYGGSGEQFDWKALETYTGTTPFFLSGGIATEDAGRLKTLHFPRLHAIDINSRFETSPGMKDVQQVKFMRDQYK
ncbi:MAG: phosphoribosylanthranilate isomerase [Bacteroidales bacterium]|nr:phosphoribosylanthranilate isomerase [Bacteroidales bacterium]